MNTNTLKKESEQIILHADKISKLYNKNEGDKSVLDILNFIKQKDTGIDKLSIDIIKNHIVGLIGSQKSGKTTVFKILSGHIKPSAGTIYYKGHKSNVDELDNMVEYFSKNKISCHQYNCTVFENFIHYASSGGINRCEAVDLSEQLIEEFGMGPYKYVNVLKLPSKIRKRMFVIRILLSKKPIILIDEPLKSIEEEYKQKFFEKMYDLCRTNDKTIIISAVDEIGIGKFCDDIIKI